ncbi:hypothetical protein HDU87_006470 [Geranomyces variabilis]|uniref:J domain-containing protein n=1 Tax=Geranomyces variabilis TaxID=109894 RepID=A0AAD5THN4_9FUNG|nr:hypothetical protein HDU87_006470 [Geranomyces variabilis]
MENNVDYYELLGVKHDATEDAIRQAYIKQSLKFHPDRNTNADATKKFQEVAQAYFVLSDKDRRNAYDRSRKDKTRFAQDEHVDPNSVFGSVFDELLVPEVPNPVWFWEPVGAAAGFVMGFIVFNIPGAMFGAWTGKKMGKVRDMKGVSTGEAFLRLSKDRKAEILSGLAQKMFSSAL